MIFILFLSVNLLTVNANLNFLSNEYIDRQIVIRSGFITYKDTYMVSNKIPGGTLVSSVDLNFPKEAEVIKAYDLMGDIEVQKHEGDQFTTATVTFRYSLKGTPYSENYSFTIEYRLPSSYALKEGESWDEYSFETKLFDNFDWIIDQLSVTVTLPEGAEYTSDSSTTLGEVKKEGLTTTLTYLIKDVENSSERDLMIKYKYLFIWSAFRPAVWVGLFGLASVIYGVSRKYNKKQVIRRPVRNVALTRSFVEICEERNNLWSELESLEDAYENKRIRRKRYVRGRKVLEERLRTAEKEFILLKNRIIGTESEYSDFINKIETAGKKIENLRRDIDRNRNQYQSRRISKEEYDRIRNKNMKSINRTKREISNLIMEIRV